MTPSERRLYLAELRAGRESALRRLRAALRASGGSPPGAARELGIGVQTLYDARRTQPAVRAVHSDAETECPRAHKCAANDEYWQGRIEYPYCAQCERHYCPACGAEAWR